MALDHCFFNIMSTQYEFFKMVWKCIFIFSVPPEQVTPSGGTETFDFSSLTKASNSDASTCCWWILVEVKRGLPHIWQHKHILHMQPVGSCIPPVALFVEAPLHHIKNMFKL